jgi:ribosomal-protein-alanine N-acetyltransferase
MNQKDITYKTKIASEEEIYLHLIECSSNFIPDLRETVDVKEYARKIHQNATTFEAWGNNRLVGLVAVYLNDFEARSAYITNVSVTREYLGLGVASILLKMSILQARTNNFSTIILEVNIANLPAVKLYEKYGFTMVEKKGTSLIMKLVF